VRAASAFRPSGGALRRLCGDWSQGIARIRCPACGFDRFRPYGGSRSKTCESPFSCKRCLPLGGAQRRLCPSCAQKRTLLLGEYLSEDLLLRLPHRQAVRWPALGFVWTNPESPASIPPSRSAGTSSRTPWGGDQRADTPSSPAKMGQTTKDQCPVNDVTLTTVSDERCKMNGVD
jgi:hypothetical protein